MTPLSLNHKKTFGCGLWGDLRCGLTDNPRSILADEADDITENKA